MTPTITVPNAQNGPFTGGSELAVHDVLVVLTEALPVQSSPVHEAEALAEIFTVSTALSAAIHPEMSLAPT